VGKWLLSFSLILLPTLSREIVRCDGLGGRLNIAFSKYHVTFRLHIASAL
jgi:hypothetical protein